MKRYGKDIRPGCEPAKLYCVECSSEMEQSTRGLYCKRCTEIMQHVDDQECADER